MRDSTPGTGGEALPAILGDITIEYEITGEGPDLVWLHGLSGSLEESRPLVTRLSQRFRVLSYSTRGHGRSTPILEPSRYRYDLIARDLAAMLDHTGFDRPLLAGGSHGANTILRHEAMFPGRARGLLLVAPGANALRRPKRPHWWLIRGHLAWAYHRRGNDGIIAAICGYDPALTHDDPAVRATIAAAQSHDMASLRAAMRFVPDQAAVDPTALPHFDLPVIVAAWDRDPLIHPIAVARTIASLIPGADFEQMARPHGLSPTASADTAAQLIGDWAARLHARLV